jgi:hypothetical protein
MNPSTGKGGHGSSMLSKIAGKQCGTAKKVTPVLTRIGNIHIYETWLDALTRIYDHVVANNNRGATLSMSLNFKQQNVNQGWINRFGKLSLVST